MHDKLHRSLVEAVIHALADIFIEKRYADKVIERTLAADPRMGGRDRAFVAENVYDLVRWWRLIGFLSDVEDGVDKRAIRQRVATWFQRKGIQLPEWLMDYHIPNDVLDKRMLEAKKLPAVLHSVPDWLYNLGIQQLGHDKWLLELENLNEQAELVIRTNTLKTTRNDLMLLLEQRGLYCQISNQFPDAILVERKGSLFSLGEFKDGLFEVQDAGSQTIAPFMRVEPGMRVIDACAGAGGKTLHIAALMKGKGRIVAMDIEGHKLEELKRRARRNGVQNIETKVIDDSKAIKRLANSADRLLLDAPCSGLGVLRRNPDAKWKLSAEFIEKIQTTQQEILQNYQQMLKPGGMMVYATCSILPVENELQVQKFLANNANFELIEEQHLWPSDGFDGFYMALIKKN